MCQQLYESIRNLKKEDGSMLYESFKQSCGLRQDSPFFHLIANPIDPIQIEQKLSINSYTHIDELTSDFELMVTNVKTVNTPDSLAYQDACQIWQYFISIKMQMLESHENIYETNRVVRPNFQLDFTADENNVIFQDNYQVSTPFYDLFAALMTANCSVTNTPLSTLFQELPSRTDYPDYYDVILHPIDLKQIANKIQSQAYATLFEMEIDFNQMINNTLAFFDSQTTIYQNAEELRQIFITRKMEIELGNALKIENAVDFVNGMAAAMSLNCDNNYENDNNCEMMKVEGDGPMWLLLQHIYSSINSIGLCLGESLWRLPKRQAFPDYYNIVKKPISLSQIRCYLRTGTYNTTDEMIAHLNLLFNNTKQAYNKNHQIYKVSCNTVDRNLGTLKKYYIAHNKKCMGNIEVVHMY